MKKVSFLLLFLTLISIHVSFLASMEGSHSASFTDQDGHGEPHSDFVTNSPLTFATIDNNAIKIPLCFIEDSQTLTDIVKDARALNATEAISIGSNITKRELLTCIDLWATLEPNCPHYRQYKFFKMIYGSFYSQKYIQRLIDIAYYLDLTKLLEPLKLSFDNILIYYSGYYSGYYCLFPKKNYTLCDSCISMNRVNFIPLLNSDMALTEDATFTLFKEFKNNVETYFYSNQKEFTLDERISFVLAGMKGNFKNINVVDPLLEYILYNVTPNSIDFHAKALCQSLKKYKKENRIPEGLCNRLLDKLLESMLNHNSHNLICNIDNVNALKNEWDLFCRSLNSGARTQKINFILFLHLLIQFYSNYDIQRVQAEQYSFFDKILTTQAYTQIKGTSLAGYIEKILKDQGTDYDKLTVEFEKRCANLARPDSLQQLCIDRFLKEHNYFLDIIRSSNTIEELIEALEEVIETFCTIESAILIHIITKIAQLPSRFTGTIRDRFSFGYFLQAYQKEYQETDSSRHYFISFLCYVYIKKECDNYNNTLALEHCIGLLNSDIYAQLPAPIKKSIVSFIDASVEDWLNKIPVLASDYLTLEESSLDIRSWSTVLFPYSCTYQQFANQESKKFFMYCIHYLLLRHLNLNIVLDLPSFKHREQAMLNCNNNVEQYINFYLCSNRIKHITAADSFLTPSFEECYDFITSSFFKSLPKPAQKEIKNQMFVQSNNHSYIKLLAQSSPIKLKCFELIRKHPKKFMFMMGVTGGIVLISAVQGIKATLAQPYSIFLKKIADKHINKLAYPLAYPLLHLVAALQYKVIDRSLSFHYLFDNKRSRNSCICWASGTLTGIALAGSYLWLVKKR